MKNALTVIKRSPAGEEVVRYAGRLLARTGQEVVLEAYFSRPDMPFMGITLKNGDRFLETYYTDRWYNIFEVYDREDGRRKGWYCNVGRPAVWEADDRLSYVDLALDLWIAPDGRQTVLDREEFSALELDTATRSRAEAALAELQTLFTKKFDPGA